MDNEMLSDRATIDDLLDNRTAVPLNDSTGWDNSQDQEKMTNGTSFIQYDDDDDVEFPIEAYAIFYSLLAIGAIAVVAHFVVHYRRVTAKTIESDKRVCKEFVKWMKSGFITEGVNGLHRDSFLLNFLFADGVMAGSILLLGFFQMSFEITFICAIGLIIMGFIASLIILAVQMNVRRTNEVIFDMSTIIVSDRYQDFGNDFFGTLLLGCGQFILIFMYLFAIWERYHPDPDPDSDSDPEKELISQGKGREYTFYILGTVVQIGYLIGKELLLKSSMNTNFWALMIADNNHKHYWTVGKLGDNEKIKFPANHVIYGRLAISFLINEMGLVLILLFLPLQLAGSADAFEFVLNSIAASLRWMISHQKHISVEK